jgi:hypothetical protein
VEQGSVLLRCVCRAEAERERAEKARQAAVGQVQLLEGGLRALPSATALPFPTSEASKQVRVSDLHCLAEH